MKILLLRLKVQLKSLMSREEGQDLIEYALLVALLSCGVVASVQGIAGYVVVHMFGNISTTLASAI